MEITFTVKLTEQGIPQLMGLLARMMANPDPGAQVVVEKTEEGKSITISPETPSTPVKVSMVANPELSVAAPPAAPEQYSVEDIGRASAAFVDADPGNMDKLLATLQAMGVQAVTQLPDAAARAEFARRMRELGANI